jgi:hypothetical protein
VSKCDERVLDREGLEEDETRGLGGPVQSAGRSGDDGGEGGDEGDGGGARGLLEEGDLWTVL